MTFLAPFQGRGFPAGGAPIWSRAAAPAAPSDSLLASAVEYAKEEFAAIRTGRAHPAMFAKLTADYYGSQTPLQQLATFQVPDARVVMITPYDQSSVPAIEKSIRDSDLGVNPSNDGKTIRVTLPQLTEQRRNELAKQAAKYSEGTKVAVRGVRRDGMEQIQGWKKKSEIGEDEAKRWSDEVQKLTDDYVKQIDVALAAKEKDIKTV